MIVVVTGSAGFIGQAVVAELGRRDHIVRPFDHRYGDDVRHPEVVDDAIRGAGGVIHLAGLLGTGELFDDPERAVDVNVKGSLNVIRSATAHHAVMVGIEMPRVWSNVYQATKTCARTLMTAWHQNRGLRCSSVRAYNAFGPGQKVHGVQKIVPTFATKAWRGEPIPIWGDGTQMVDLVYVDDVARMLVDALAFGDDQTFDAGTGQGLSVREVAYAVLRTVENHGVDGPGAEYLPMRDGETPTKVMAHGEGWDLLDWHPEMDWQRFAETVQWYREDRP